MKNLLVFPVFLFIVLCCAQAQLSIYRGPGKECIDDLNLNDTEVYVLLHRKPLPLEETLVKFWKCVWAKEDFFNDDSTVNLENFRPFIVGIYKNVLNINEVDCEEFAIESTNCCKNIQEANLGKKAILILNCVQEWRPGGRNKCIY